MICPSCAHTASLDAVNDAKGACPKCGYRNEGAPNRLLTVEEMQADRRVWDGVCLGSFLRAYSALMAQVR